MPGDGNTTRPDADARPGHDDGTLIVRAAEGDEEAFTSLVRRHSPGALQLATRLLGNRTEAEDAVQDAFVQAWRSLPEFRAEASFKTWTYRILRELDGMPYETIAHMAGISQEAVRGRVFRARRYLTEAMVAWR